MSLFLPLLACATSAALAVPVFRRWRGTAGWYLAIGPLVGLAVLLWHAPTVLNGEVLQAGFVWSETLNLSIHLRLDPWALVLGLVVTGIGAPLLVYAASYAADDERGGRMIAMLAAFAAAMLGLVMADHLLLIYVCWEITSVLSFLLVGYKHGYADARYSARRALVITIAGGLALLAGLLLLAMAGDTWSLTQLLAQGSLAEHAFYPAIVGCVALAAMTKSAQWPFHVWLPGAMAAPTPVSCYLHAATMVKAGVYLLAVLMPVLGGTSLWLGLVGGMGAFTAAYAGLRCTAQQDAKGLVAWSTVSALGLMMLLVGIATPLAATALVCLVLAHATYKATLFMVVGSIDHGTGTRNLDQLGGLRRAMPWTAATAGVAALSLLGLPPVMGFVAKEYLLKAGLEAPWWAITAIIPAALGGAAAAIALAYVAFWRGEDRAEALHPHEAPLGMRLPAAVIAGIGALLGPLTAWLGSALIAPTGSQVAGALAPAAKAWPGTDLVLLLSIVLALAGGALGLGLAAWRSKVAWAWPGGGILADRLIDSVMVVARWHTRILVHGNLRWYVASLVAVATVVMAIALVMHQGDWEPPPMAAHTLDWPALMLILAGLAGVLRLRHRIAAMIALGAMGAGVALLFIGRGAPDLALTQLLVEALTVLLFVLAFRRLPELKQHREPVAQVGTALLALGFGIVIAGVMLAVPDSIGIGAAFHELSWNEAYGRNIVNVILVDFRAFDTLGEIAVLGLAALGVLAVLRRSRSAEPPPAVAAPPTAPSQGVTP